MPAVYTLYREQIVETKLESAWDFISSPKNLDKITPPDMRFTIITDLPDRMYEGLLIEYRIAIPLLGEQTWLTELKHIREGHSFVDEQRTGPYRFWYHYHEVVEVEGGVKFIDRINYIMPLGPFGGIAHAFYVKNQLKKVFDFRETAIPQQFGSEDKTLTERAQSTILEKSNTDRA